MSTRLFWLVVGVTALCAALAGFLLAAQLERTAPELASGAWLAQPKSVIDFHLIDSRGQPFTRADLLGRPTLVYFGYTHCPDECPDTMAALARMMKEGTIPRLRVLFVTVDPRRDTPGALARFLGQFDPAFIGLTGSASELRRLAASLGIAATRIGLPGGDDTFEHSIALFLFDARAREVAVFTPPFDIARLRATLRREAPRLRAAA
jgi:protein SCO1/2